MPYTSKCSLSRTTLKYIALAAMLCDHTAYFLVSHSAHPLIFSLMRGFGRFTAPIMCYFLAEGFIFSHSHRKYALRLGIFALLSQIPWTLALHKTLFTWDFFTDQNMIYTLFISFLILCVWKYMPEQGWKQVLIVLLFVMTYNSDWGLYAPTWVLLFYFYRNDLQKKWLFYFVVAALEIISSFSDALSLGYGWYECIWKFGLLLVIPLLISYNGNKGKTHPFHKWVFYLIYPLQFFMFYFLQLEGIRFVS